MEIKKVEAYEFNGVLYKTFKEAEDHKFATSKIEINDYVFFMRNHPEDKLTGLGECMIHGFVKKIYEPSERTPVWVNNPGHKRIIYFEEEGMKWAYLPEDLLLKVNPDKINWIPVEKVLPIDTGWYKIQTKDGRIKKSFFIRDIQNNTSWNKLAKKDIVAYWCQNEND